ncbi:hypothetical protein HNP46_000054 [Pseudomonas nitritireducens]|uniref:Uncharacterized protein n=1 Tax=Pseudomonas nitroreducens TaxID=46680 RepID=A0A7W7KFP6_PSENT|nr:hypothetical protein [Pseudomonas nitritireducens]MBB4861243.1 hypothetical protein [Pseudomonas nitritireducens]
MQATEQAKGQSVLEHGHSVRRYYQDLRAHVLEGTPLQYEWKIPDWARDKGLWERVVDDQDATLYQVWHDCGKPYCRVVDEEGRAHFPDHARVSGETWRRVGGSEQVARLMELDMDIHLLKADDLQEFASRPEAATLLLTGLCEVHSNASMFGGLDSTSFKAKWKHLDRRGKQLSKMIV